MCMRGLKLNINIGRASVMLVLLMVLASCQDTPPQPVRILGEEQQAADSMMMAYQEFNRQMTAAADKQCSDYVKSDSLTYTLDKRGFWYARRDVRQGEMLQQGESVVLDMQVYELNDSVIADVHETFNVGGGTLPLAIDQSLKMMRRGERMHIVAPWYTAYGVEGTNLVRGYTNLKIVIRVES